MNAVEEAWRRSELETLTCEYHGIFDDTKKRFAKYPRIIKFKLDLLKYLKRRLAAENHLRALHVGNMYFSGPASAVLSYRIHCHINKTSDARF